MKGAKMKKKINRADKREAHDIFSENLTILQKSFNDEKYVTTINIPKIDGKWINILSSIKIQTLQDDFKMLHQSTESFLETKNKHLRSFLGEFEDGSVFSRMLFSSNMDAFDRLLNIFHMRTKNFITQNMSALEISDSENSLNHLSDVCRLQKEKYINDEIEIQSAMNEKMRDARFLHAAIMDDMQLRIEENLEKLLIQMQSQLASRANNEEYETLLAKDEEYAKVVTNQLYEISNLKDKVHILQCQLKSVSPATGLTVPNWSAMEIDERKNEKMAVMNRYLVLKDQLGQFMCSDQKKLLQLTNRSNRACEGLELLLLKKLRILKMKHLCDEYVNDRIKKPHFSYQFRSMASWVGFGKLETFWERLGEVEVDCRQLKKTLYEEHQNNRHLKSLLVDYFKSYNVN